MLNRSVEKKQKVDKCTKRTTSEISTETTETDPNPNAAMVCIFPAVEVANQALAADADTDVVIDKGSLAHKESKKKQDIMCPPNDQLAQISYFKIWKVFLEARQHDLMLEKQGIQSARFGEDNMTKRNRAELYQLIMLAFQILSVVRKVEKIIFRLNKKRASLHLYS